MAERTTIHDVASAAGVSIATVSRVLSGSPGAGEAVRQRVRRVASEMGYRGDSVARSLRSRRSHMLGLLVPDIRNPFFPALVQAVEVALRARDDGLLFADAQDSVSVEADRVRSMLDRRLDALLISPIDEIASEAIVAEAAAQLPVVQLDRRAGNAAPHVGVDHAGAIAMAVEHLRGMGRRRFAFVGYDQGVSTSEARLAAFLEHAGRLDPGCVERVLPERTENGEEIPEEWLDRVIGEVDAVIATSDLIAVSLRDSLAERGLRLPEDIALVSFDDTLLAAAANLSSIRQPLQQMAEASIGLVSGQEVELPPEGFQATLVIRKSSNLASRAR